MQKNKKIKQSKIPNKTLRAIFEYKLDEYGQPIYPIVGINWYGIKQIFNDLLKVCWKFIKYIFKIVIETILPIVIGIWLSDFIIK